MEPTNENLSKLSERIAEREAFLRIIIVFAKTVVRDYGRVTEKEQRSDYTKIVRKLEDFSGFDIEWHIGRSNHIEIWYTLEGRKLRVFLMFYWSGIEDCQVNIFYEENDWKDMFISVAERADNILAEKDAGRTHAQQEAQREEEMAQLKKRAEKLKLL